MVRILPLPPGASSCAECRRRYPGMICTVLRAFIGRDGEQRYEVDVPAHHRRGNLQPIERVLAPVNDPPSEGKTTWEEFTRLTGCDPRRVPEHA